MQHHPCSLPEPDRLKALFSIACFSVVLLKAQMPAPDLRCLEVLPNGNVKLHWISPPDPNGQFFSYQVFASNNPASTFSLAGTIGAQATNSFVHNTDASGTSMYYYMNTTFGSGGSGSSVHSDTLRSLFLNIVPAAVDLKLLYNPLKTPKLPSSSSTYTIQKEYPMGTWSLLGTTQALQYSDTITVCGDSMSYQVQLPDNSGCLSTSNIQKGKYTDQKPPNQPYIDSLSVLPNGQCILTWRIPRDLDIDRYAIYEKSLAGTNNFLATVPGRSSTSYVYTLSTANTRTVQLFVSAVDSCDNISTFNEEPTSLFLQSSYDVCAYKTQLNWNDYKGLHTGVKEYVIYHSVNGSVFKKIGSTTGSSFVHEDAEPGKDLCYFVRVVNSEGQITASSNRLCFFSRQVKAPAYVYIRSASVSDKHMELRLLLDTLVGSDGIELQRSVNGSEFQNIAFLPTNGFSAYQHLDPLPEGADQAYYYRAIVRDSCGNARTQSQVCKSVYLSVKSDPDNLFAQKLSWNAYEGFAGSMSGYYIYRIGANGETGQALAFTDAFTTYYTDLVEDEAMNGTQISYRVQAIEGLSNPFGIREQAFSNPVPVYTEDMLFVPNAFAPDGLNNVWKPVTHFIDKSEYQVLVYDRWGHKVFETNRDDEGWDGKGYGSGVYSYQIRYKNSRGEYKSSHGYINLIR